METPSSKLRQKQRELTHEEQRQTVDAEGQTFDSAESMIRFDAEQTALPESLPGRLAESVEIQSNVSGSWWQRLLGKDKE